jgi:hypothetical protein
MFYDRRLGYLSLQPINNPAFYVQKTLSNYICVQKLDKNGFPYMLVGGSLYASIQRQ